MHNPEELNELNLAGEALVAWLDTLRLGTPRRSGPLAIVAVYGDAGCATVAYHTLSEAISSTRFLKRWLTA